MADKKILNKDYFKKRNLNDDLRLKAFDAEKSLVKKYISSGNILDVGCSTGEMIEFYDWKGDCYGMEIIDYAINEAKKRGISFEKDLTNSKNFFDVIIFRGTIQHVDTPFLYIKNAMEALKPNGFLIFLATPNANSIYFKIWKTLPFLDMPSATYFIPHEKWFIQAVTNYGFVLKEQRFPYLASPYARPFRDHLKFFLKLLGFKVKFPFWKNSMELIFQKPSQ
jgi:2-polyprenyl-3-methyl-5-hydroxy-6-metoxy-1,4-benzoquinol methylase